MPWRLWPKREWLQTIEWLFTLVFLTSWNHISKSILNHHDLSCSSIFPFTANITIRTPGFPVDDKLTGNRLVHRPSTLNTGLVVYSAGWFHLKYSAPLHCLRLCGGWFHKQWICSKLLNNVRIIFETFYSLHTNKYFQEGPYESFAIVNKIRVSH